MPGVRQSYRSRQSAAPPRSAPGASSSRLRQSGSRDRLRILETSFGSCSRIGCREASSNPVPERPPPGHAYPVGMRWGPQSHAASLCQANDLGLDRGQIVIVRLISIEVTRHVARSRFDGPRVSTCAFYDWREVRVRRGRAAYLSWDYRREGGHHNCFRRSVLAHRVLRPL
jgi:hypothetical protein